MLFADLLSLHLVTFLMLFILVHVTFFSSRCMLELKFAIYYRAASLPSQASYAVLAEESQAFFRGVGNERNLVHLVEKSVEIKLKLWEIKADFLELKLGNQPHPLLQLWRHPWGKSRGNQREIRKSRTPKLLVADPSLSSSTPRTQTVFRNNYISLLSDLCACVHLKKKWRRKGSHSSSVSGSKLMNRIASYDFKPGKKATGWCTAQWKMLLFYAKTIVKESREFELARRLKKKKKKKKKKENTLAVWWLSGSVLSRCFLAPLGVLFVDHENTRGWTERCYNGL